MTEWGTRVDEVLLRSFHGDLRHRQVLVIGDEQDPLWVAAQPRNLRLFCPHAESWPEPYRYDLILTTQNINPTWLGRCDQLVWFDAEGTSFWLQAPPTDPMPFEDRVFEILNLVWRCLTPASDIEKSNPSVDPHEILNGQVARCDQYVKVFLFLCRVLLGVRGREVALNNTADTEGHTVAELFYEGSWHMFDADETYRKVYRRAADGQILGVCELCLDRGLVERDCPALLEFFAPTNRFFRFTGA